MRSEYCIKCNDPESKGFTEVVPGITSCLFDII